MKRKTRLWLRFILVGLLAGALYLLMLNYEQEFVYAPSPFVKKTPHDAGMAFDSVVFASDDGVNIQGWFIPAQSSDPPPTNSSALTLLYLHGRAGNMGDSLEKIHLFHDMGLDVFAIDYHGYGASGGTPSESALTGDALAAYFYLVEKRNVKPERMYICGEDLGATVAIGLAAKVEPAGLITEGANASIIEKVEEDWPLIPWQYLLRNQFDAVSKMGDVHVPVLMFHSSDDEVVPFNDSRRLYVLAHEPKELVEIHGSHREAFVKSFDTYYDKIDEFVHRDPKAKTAETASSTQTRDTASKPPTP
ncbi:MAG TPA: alpha/beta hydrolase [Verrucomicrobiae bacterium]|nr:alpha/beta hydrolase [Verrucomicrobiae bacterium]